MCNKCKLNDKECICKRVEAFFKEAKDILVGNKKIYAAFEIGYHKHIIYRIPSDRVRRVES